MKKRPYSFFKPYGYTTLEDVLFIFGWVILGFLLSLAIIGAASPELLKRLLLPCPIFELTGVYCPGCGGTRAVKALLRGDGLLSIRYHPVVVYIAVLGSVFMVSQTLERATKGKIKGLRYKNAFLYIFTALYLISFAVKNIYGLPE